MNNFKENLKNKYLVMSILAIVLNGCGSGETSVYLAAETENTGSYTIKQGESFTTTENINVFGYGGTSVHNGVIAENEVASISNGFDISAKAGGIFTGFFSETTNSTRISQNSERSTINNYSGNGVYIKIGDTEKLNNEGKISGNSTLVINNYSGNAINVYGGKIVNLENSGILLGETSGNVSNSYSGNAILTKEIEMIENSGLILGMTEGNKNEYSGNAVNLNYEDNQTAEKLLELKNLGLVVGEALGNNNQSGNGLYIDISKNQELKINFDNIGYLLGTAEGENNNQSGNGLFVGSMPLVINSLSGEINNSGVIQGNAYSRELNIESGNGIGIVLIDTVEEKLDKNINITEITNVGIISGKTISEKEYSENTIEIEGGILGTRTEKVEIKHDETTKKDYYEKENGATIEKIDFVKNINQEDSGNGIYMNLDGSDINMTIVKLSNTGMLDGKATGHKNQNSGNGLGILINAQNAYTNKISNLSNTGIISGEVLGRENQSSGNGVLIGSYGEKLTNQAKITTLKNAGIIRGGIFGGDSYNPYSGNGIYLEGEIELLSNFGIIQGTESAINVEKINTFNNLGIITGKNPNSEGEDSQGIKVVFNEDKTVSVEGVFDKIQTRQVSMDSIKNTMFPNIEITETANVIYSIKNTKTTLNTDDLLKLKSKVIINGFVSDELENETAIPKAIINITKNLELEEAIINSLGIAINLENDAILTGTNIVVNGGGLGEINEGTLRKTTDDYIEYRPVILGDDGGNTLNIREYSTINGDIDLGLGDDKILVENTVRLNGKIRGGDGKDNLTIESSQGQENQLQINHNIENVETITIEGETYLGKDAVISGLEELNLNGKLYLGIDSSENLQGTVVAKGLYQNDYTLTIGNTGELVLDLNGISKTSEIDLGYTNIIGNTDQIITNSIVLTPKVDEDGILNVEVKRNLSQVVEGKEIENYEKRSAVYNSIILAAEIGKLSGTTLKEAGENPNYNSLLKVLDGIYQANPYAYTINTTRDNMRMFREHLSVDNQKGSINNWITTGKVITKKIENHDKENILYKTKVETAGGLVNGEYGYSNDMSLGLALGVVSQDINYKDQSNIEGEGIYLGAYQKMYKGKVEFINGIGYNYVKYNGNRKTISGNDILITGDKYNSNGFVFYTESRYIIEKNNGLKFIPNIKGSVYYVDQSKVNEGITTNGVGMEIENQKHFMGDISLGLELVKNEYLKKGSIKHLVGIDVSKTFESGDNDLVGRIIGTDGLGNDFEVDGIDLPSGEGKIYYKVEYENDKGLEIIGGIGYRYTTNEEEDIELTLGLGYGF